MQARTYVRTVYGTIIRIFSFFLTKSFKKIKENRHNKANIHFTTISSNFSIQKRCFLTDMNNKYACAGFHKI